MGARRLASVLALALALGAPPLAAQEIVADLSQNRVAIDATFDGSEIVVFGAIKQGAIPVAEEPPMEVIVTVSGPQEPVTVRKKARVAGIWVNSEAVEIDAAPTLYKVVTSGPLEEVLSETEDLRHSITVDRAIRAVDAATMGEHTPSFIEALVRIREDDGLYLTNEGAVRFTAQALFSTTIKLPANLVEGDYRTRIYLTQDGAVLARYERVLDVRKVGLERFIYSLAHEQPLAYGLLSIAIAIVAGWGASAAFRYLRG
ncbi:MAG: TIGR02186 family protein [Pseudomonadota bacterium]